MDGTTLCPHCNTRFKIAEAQLEAHHGMVRCGHCLQAFDARPGFIPDEPIPQLELPILEEAAPQPESHAVEEVSIQVPAEEVVRDEVDELLSAAGFPEPLTQEEPASPQPETTVDISTAPTTEEIAEAAAAPTEATDHETLDFLEAVTAAQSEAGHDELKVHHEGEASQPMTLAERVAIVEEETEESQPRKKLIWPWAVSASLLTIVLLAQAAYFFRVELAARMPGLKPALIAWCQPLKCEVPLPHNNELMGIESSDLEADPAHGNLITLHALLRNRASYAQAFPELELTLNDIDDKALARRVFRPADYLPPVEKEQIGLLPNHELVVKLRLDVGDLKPTGYRLVLFYPAVN
ncbi:membrane protein [Ferrigenium kumadai]|uniref:Membrane protein n=1 Tax=Ferrigenium kumadai TaxID=1682490 RepID=A0AAN1W0L5_9PROT|nr:zinc-ribbon and DUF3426 domain-containing protein [Ferrigenium kumadai]BBJ00594.1 membrane protein [Ferrigenium kumadai]